MTSTDDVQHEHLIVPGAGSGSLLPGEEPARLRTALVEPDRFGGTCSNRRSTASTMLVVAADAARAAEQGRRRHR